MRGFVPTEEEDIKKLADAQGKTVEQIKTIIASLHEFNPMMGHRGCRLAVTYPEIAKMQTSAVIRAAINVKKAHPDWNVKPEIMIPLVAGKPVRSSPLSAIGIAVAVSCLIAFLVCMILKGQMKSVRKGVDANVYTTAGGGLKLTDSYDHYTHTTETRRKIESDSGGGGRSSGGTVSRSGGGGHGRSGKF